MNETQEIQLISVANQELIQESGAEALLLQIRPQWQAKNLIQRVSRLLAVDPSSACQRIFNAAVYDLKEKIVVAGLDIAADAANQYRMPPITKPEDVENYTVSRIIDLAYRMGLLTRPEWRRLLRVYDIRRDLEHEDYEYEATVEDCVYIFKTSIEVVLARDPVHLLKLIDIKDIVEQPSPATLGETVLQDYKQAPETRQLAIYRFLISTALDDKHPDIVRQNCYNVLGLIQEFTERHVMIECANDMIKRLGRTAPTLLQARVCFSAGILPYLKKSMLKDFFGTYYEDMASTGYSFKSYAEHGDLLRNLQDVGGLTFCPDSLLPQFVKWLVLCYIGEQSFGKWSSVRRVFYSNVGAPIAYEILQNCGKDLESLILQIEKDDDVSQECRNEYVARRYQELVDLVAI